MRLLAVDTATAQATCAVCDSERVLAQRDRRVTTHSEALLTLIDETLRAAATAIVDLDAVVCGRGPGSFTGLRIGMATVKGICFAAKKPLICVPSMIGVAGAVNARCGADQLLAVILDARRDEVFCGLFRGGEPLGDEALLRPEAVAAFVDRKEPVLVAGDGALRYRDAHFAHLPLAAADCHAIEAGYLALFARRRAEAGEHDDLRAAVPRYLRGPDIRRPATGSRNASRDPQASFLEQRGGTPLSGGLSDELGAGQEEALLEKLRKSGLRLDRDGRWWHRDEPVQHERLALALHRWLSQLPDGRFVVRVDAQRYAYVEVEDAPFVVRTIEIPTEETQPLRLLLSDGTIEPLDARTLAVGADDALYCRVKRGRFAARLTRAAHNLVARWIVEDGAGGFAFARGTLRATIGQRPRSRDEPTCQ